jgi:integrase/recombinase XerD
MSEETNEEKSSERKKAIVAGARDFEALLERYLKTRRSEGTAPGTLVYRRVYLAHFLSWLKDQGTMDLRAVRPEAARDYAVALARHRYRLGKAEGAEMRALKPRTRTMRLLVVRDFFRWLVKTRLLLFDPTAALSLVFKKHQLPRHVLSEKDVERLLLAPDPATPIGLRDRAILALLYSTGLRRSEVAALDLTDADLTDGSVFVRRGKGGKSRLVPLGQSAAADLVAYLQKGRPELAHGHRIPRTPALFVGVGGPGRKNQGGRLQPDGVSLLVRRTSEKAKLEKPVMAHALRHALATHLLRAGADIRHVQRILGHSAVSTTEIYTHVAARDLAEVHARSHPRGGGPKPRRPVRLDPRYPAT